MRYTAIPNTDLVVSVISLGTGGAGANYDRAAAFALLDAFFEEGGNFVDTAHVYNDWIPGERSRSEKLLGAWMHLSGRRNRSGVLLATKGAHPDLAHMQVGRLSPAEIQADVEESLRFLQTETIDLYWLHRDDTTRPVEEIIDTLEAQAQAGKIRYYGCSNWRLERLQAAQLYSARRARSGFVGVQNLWSLAKPNLDVLRQRDATLAVMDDDLWQYHRQTGLAAIPYTSQANGLFQKMDTGGTARLPADLARLYLSPETEGRYQRLKILSQQTGLTTTQIGLGWLTSQPFATCPVIGPQSLAQLARLPDGGGRAAHARTSEFSGGWGVRPSSQPSPRGGRRRTLIPGFPQGGKEKTPDPAGLIPPPARGRQIQAVLGPTGGDAPQGVFPGADAAGGVGGFHVTGAHPHCGGHHLEGRQVAQQAAEETGDGGVPGAGGADHLHLKAGGPQLLVSPGIQVGRGAAAHLSQLLDPGSAQIQAALTQLDHRHLHPQPQQFIAHVGEQLRGNLFQQTSAASLRQAVVGLAPQHKKQFLDAGAEDIYIRQHAPQDGRPVRLAAGRGRVGQGHIQRSGRPGGLGPAVDLQQPGALFYIHAPHDGRVAKMENAGLRRQAPIDILSAKAVVGARAVQEKAIHAGRADDNRIRGSRALVGGNALRQPRPLGGDNAAHDLPEGVVPTRAIRSTGTPRRCMAMPVLGTGPPGAKVTAPATIRRPGWNSSLNWPGLRCSRLGIMSRQMCPATTARNLSVNFPSKKRITTKAQRKRFFRKERRAEIHHTHFNTPEVKA